MDFIQVDNNTVCFKKNCPIFKRTHTKPRKLFKGFIHNGIKYSEEILLRSLGQFDPDKSEAYKYLLTKLNAKCVQYEIIAGLCRVLANYLSLPIPREYYRRKKTVLFWMELNLDNIKNFISSHVITISYKQNIYHL